MPDSASQNFRPTRGKGRLEKFLSKQRTAKVLKAIDPNLFLGEVLDIGCGTFPGFLLAAPFQKKVGVDQIRSDWADELYGDQHQNLKIIHADLAGTIQLPFPNQQFDCITSLACIEHLEPESLPSLFREMHRLLKPGGQVVLTTPHAFANIPLQIMAWLGLVSKEEIEEHKSLFFHHHILSLFEKSQFSSEAISVQGFQFGLNILAVARQQ